MGNLMLPTQVGVYRFERPEMTVFVQLDIDGRWWPFPYSFSGWRESELSNFTSYFKTEDAPDAPAATQKRKAKHEQAAAEAKVVKHTLKLQLAIRELNKANRAVRNIERWEHRNG